MPHNLLTKKEDGARSIGENTKRAKEKQFNDWMNKQINMKVVKKKAKQVNQDFDH